MIIEEDFEQVRECLIGIYGKDPHAALDRIEGYIEQCADFQHTAEDERDALKNKLGWERRRVLALREERDALKALITEIVGSGEPSPGWFGRARQALAKEKA